VVAAFMAAPVLAAQAPKTASPAPPAGANAAAPAAAQAQHPPTQQPAAPGAPAEPVPEPYSYNPDGRRDPFVSLAVRGVETVAQRGAGVAGLTVDELMVRGVLLNKGSYIALVSGPDKKTFKAQVNDRLADGTIRSISPQGLVIMQEVNDPLSLIKQREVRKGLRALEDGKQ